MGTKEKLIMWGSVLLVIFVIGLIATSGGEKNYLNPSGNRNPANQKLMVVDQDTGEISFIQKSLQGVNAQIASDDAVITNALRNLLGDNMNNYGGYTKTGNDGVLAKMVAADHARRAHEDAKYATKTSLKSVEDDINTFKHTDGMQTMRDMVHASIRHGHGIKIMHHGHDRHGKNYKWRYLRTHDCDRKNGNGEGAHWCDHAHDHSELMIRRHDAQVNN